MMVAGAGVVGSLAFCSEKAEGRRPPICPKIEGRGRFTEWSRMVADRQVRPATLIASAAASATQFTGGEKREG